jgi:hypothetical protein
MDPIDPCTAKLEDRNNSAMYKVLQDHVQHQYGKGRVDVPHGLDKYLLWLPEVTCSHPQPQ